MAEEPSALSKSIAPSSAEAFMLLVDASRSGGEEACLDNKAFVNDAAAGVDTFRSEFSCSMSKGEESCRRAATLVDSATCWSDIWMP